MLLLHYTAMESGTAATAWLCAPQSRVSSHYLVDEDGRIDCMVSEARRAWHAGVSIWQGESDINSRSIGIEIQNLGHGGGRPDYPEAQIAALIVLARGILARHAIVPERVLAHSDVAPHRKIDPGERFPWARLAGEGVGLWAEPDPPDEAGVLVPGMSGPEVRDLQASLARFGYGIEASGQYDGETASVVSAFQRHWRPMRVDGRADRSTRDQLGRIAALAARARARSTPPGTRPI